MLISSNSAFTGTSRLCLTEYLGTTAREQCACVCVCTHACAWGGRALLAFSLAVSRGLCVSSLQRVWPCGARVQTEGGA